MVTRRTVGNHVGPRRLADLAAHSVIAYQSLPRRFRSVDKLDEAHIDRRLGIRAVASDTCPPRIARGRIPHLHGQLVSVIHVSLSDSNFGVP